MDTTELKRALALIDRKSPPDRERKSTLTGTGASLMIANEQSSVYLRILGTWAKAVAGNTTHDRLFMTEQDAIDAATNLILAAHDASKS